jgi:hypothetical protein
MGDVWMQKKEEKKEKKEKKATTKADYGCALYCPVRTIDMGICVRGWLELKYHHPTAYKLYTQLLLTSIVTFHHNIIF